MAFPDAQPHGSFTEVFDGIFLVPGTVRMKGPLPMAFSRNMIVVRQGDELVLVHSMRLSEAGLKELEALGEVKHVIRLAGFHGMDDPFYADRYGATVWAVKGQRYSSGFDNTDPSAKTYFEAHEEMTPDSKLPLEGAKLITFPSSKVPEGMILLEREGGILLPGDALQNWHRADEYFNLPAKLVMKLMGFLKPCNVGPGWLKAAKPRASDVRTVLDLDFRHVLPVHGSTVLGDAKARFRPAIERVS